MKENTGNLTQSLLFPNDHSNVQTIDLDAAPFTWGNSAPSADGAWTAPPKRLKLDEQLQNTSDKTHHNTAFQPFYLSSSNSCFQTPEEHHNSESAQGFAYIPQAFMRK